MNKEDLQAIKDLLKEELQPIKIQLASVENKVSSLEKDNREFRSEVNTKLNDIKSLVEDLEPKNANRHLEIEENLKKVNVKLEELKDLKQVTKENCYDIAKLKAVK